MDIVKVTSSSAGLSDMDVARNYIGRCIEPLQRRSRPTWLYTESDDHTRLQRQGLTPLEIRTWVKGITGEDAPFTEVPAGAVALHARVPNPGALNYPLCNEWGIESDPLSGSPPPQPRTRTSKEPASESEGEDDSEWDSEGTEGADAGDDPHHCADESSGGEKHREVEGGKAEDNDDDDDVPLLRLAVAHGASQHGAGSSTQAPPPDAGAEGSAGSRGASEAASIASTAPQAPRVGKCPQVGGIFADRVLVLNPPRSSVKRGQSGMPLASPPLALVAVHGFLAGAAHRRCGHSCPHSTGYRPGIRGRRSCQGTPATGPGVGEGSPHTEGEGAQQRCRRDAILAAMLTTMRRVRTTTTPPCSNC
ncbi:uncharacterized protein LOC106865572 isoform X2 [Brachypodium distachyon]|uniref:uncharacterized protein LOC106865572 isoform X2 n=1 Tax=Brachypodium distachyon TaxID=15368 RepID=UPI000D0CDE2A|nr:uncharacterized protein LOC106865572 isoform X2 [Brachypodium distachyon]|eukprot:XP_024311216.1 uncharacterized protein LOC106865572 isoform X2 [Brachypodium distachyon]